MRAIEWTSQFKRDYKRECKGKYRGTFDADLFSAIELLTNDQPLQQRHRDHTLTDEWKDR